MHAYPMRYPTTTNVVAIGLVLSTLATAGVWTPTPPPPENHHAEHAVREGRCVVIVEYERELPLSPGDDVKETHVLPRHSLDGGEARGVVSDTADKVAGAAEDGEEKLSNAKESTKGKVFAAVKHCKDRLCGAAKKAEEGAKDEASLVKHGSEDAVRGAEETLSGAKGRAEDKVFDVALETKEIVKGAKDKVTEAAGEAKEKASHIKDGAAETMKSAKGKVFEAAKNAKNNAKETVKNAKERVSDTTETVEEYAQDAAESTVEKVEQAEEVAKAKAGEVTKNLTDIARRARDEASDTAVYLLGTPIEAARTATAVMHLMGFATAYGACVWVTIVSSYVLAAALPRRQLGMVQSKLYPVYFRTVAYDVGLALAAHLLGRERSTVAVMLERTKVEKKESRGQDMADIVNPLGVTVATAATATTPATAVARTPVDGLATGKAAKTTSTVTADAEMPTSRLVRLNKRLKKRNSYSSLCNALALMALTWHLVHLAHCLQMSSACQALGALCPGAISLHVSLL